MFRQNLVWRIPLKIASILAGVAIAALSASTASADILNFGQKTIGGVTSNSTLGDFNFGNSFNVNAPNAAWHVFGGTGPNNGAESTSDGATFTLKGSVTPDCAYYSGDSANKVIDFGTIGINATDDVGPVAAFTMANAAVVVINTNLAGCNTASKVKITKSDVGGLVNATPGGYDTNAFQANLPYSVQASYTASGNGAPAAGAGQLLEVAANQLSNTSAQHGAWKSAMSMNVLIMQPTKALVAGAYEGSFSVLISTGL